MICWLEKLRVSSTKWTCCLDAAFYAANSNTTMLFLCSIQIRAISIRAVAVTVVASATVLIFCSLMLNVYVCVYFCRMIQASFKFFLFSWVNFNFGTLYWKNPHPKRRSMRKKLCRRWDFLFRNVIHIVCAT